MSLLIKILRIILSLAAASVIFRLWRTTARISRRTLSTLQAIFLETGHDSNRSHYPGELNIEKAIHLTADEREVEARFAALIESDLWAHIKRYCRKHKNVLNTDEARELSPDYNLSLETRSRYARAVHEPAGALIKVIWRWMLKQVIPSDKNNIVMFMAGGAGSGKSTVIEDQKALHYFREQAHIIYDTTMSGLDSSVKKVEEARAHGKNVLIIYIHRPCQLAARGMIERAIRNGRTVPAQVLAEDHFNAQRTFLELFYRYSSEEEFAFFVIDNSAGRGESLLIEDEDKMMEFLHSVLYNDVGEVRSYVKYIIEDEYSRRQGTDQAIPEYVYRAIVGKVL